MQQLTKVVLDAAKEVDQVLRALAQGHGVLVVDDMDRENEGDFIFAAQSFTEEQMA